MCSFRQFNDLNAPDSEWRMEWTFSAAAFNSQSCAQSSLCFPLLPCQHKHINEWPRNRNAQVPPPPLEFCKRTNGLEQSSDGDSNADSASVESSGWIAKTRCCSNLWLLHLCTRLQLATRDREIGKFAQTPSQSSCAIHWASSLWGGGLLGNSCCFLGWPGEAFVVFCLLRSK